MKANEESTDHIALLLQTADAIRRYFKKIVDQEGLTWQQYTVLRILQANGDDGMPTMEIGARMVEQTPGLTRIVDRLEVAGLVDRSRGTGDRRMVVCRLRPSARDILARLEPEVSAAEAATRDCLSDADQEKLQAFLKRIQDSIEDA